MLWLNVLCAFLLKFLNRVLLFISELSEEGNGEVSCQIHSVDRTLFFLLVYVLLVEKCRFEESG